MEIHEAPCFFVAGIIAILFFFVKFFEMRFVTKEVKPLKVFVIDSMYVFFTSMISIFLIKQFKILKSPNGDDGLCFAGGSSSVQAFVDKPNF